MTCAGEEKAHLQTCPQRTERGDAKSRRASCEAPTNLGPEPAYVETADLRGGRDSVFV